MIPMNEGCPEMKLQSWAKSCDGVGVEHSAAQPFLLYVTPNMFTQGLLL